MAWCCFLTVAISGCKTLGPSEKFAFDVEADSSVLKIDSAELTIEADEDEAIALSVDELNVSDLAMVLARDYDISAVFAEDLLEKNITFSVAAVGVDDLLSLISRALDVRYYKVGNAYYVGKCQRADRGFQAFPIVGFTSDELTQLIKPLLSELGTSAISGNFLVVTDEVVILENVARLLRSYSSVSFPVKFVFVGVSDSTTFGASGTFSASYLGGSAVKDTAEVLTGFSTELALKAYFDKSHVSRLRSFSVRVSEGQKFKRDLQTQIPYRKRVVVESGAVVDGDLAFIDVGFSLAATIFPVGENWRVQLTVDDGVVTDYVDSLPIKQESQLVIDTVCKGGGYTLLGAFDSSLFSTSMGFLSGAQREKELTQTLLYVKLPTI